MFENSLADFTRQMDALKQHLEELWAKHHDGQQVSIWIHRFGATQNLDDPDNRAVVTVFDDKHERIADRRLDLYTENPLADVEAWIRGEEDSDATQDAP